MTKRRFPIRLTKQNTTIISVKEAHLNQSESEMQKLEWPKIYQKNWKEGKNRASDLDILRIIIQVGNN